MKGNPIRCMTMMARDLPLVRARIDAIRCSGSGDSEDCACRGCQRRARVAKAIAFVQAAVVADTHEEEVHVMPWAMWDVWCEIVDDRTGG